MSTLPFSDLEIFDPELRSKKYYQRAMKQIRGILIRSALRNFGVKEIEKLTKEQIDAAITNLTTAQPLFGLWPPMVEALQKGLYLEDKLVVREIVIQLPERVEVSPGKFEEKFIRREENVVESRISKPAKPKGFVSEKIIDRYTFHPSMVVATQTGTGKTDVAALAGLKAILEGRGKVLYLVPLRALAREKERTFRKMWGEIEKEDGTTIQISKEYLDVEGLIGQRPIEKNDWLICTNEKADSLIRRKHPFIENLAVLIVDEGDFISEEGRGPTLEVIVTRIKQRYPKVQIIFLSATIPMASIRPLAFWLNLRPGISTDMMQYFITNISQYFIRSYWRPVKLTHTLYLDGKGYFVECMRKKGAVTSPISGTVKIAQEYSDPILNITLDTIRRGGQVLIFRSTRLYAASTAKKIATMIAEYVDPVTKKRLLTPNEIKALDKVPIRTKTAVERELERVFKMGVAFHHSGIPSRTLERIEETFRDGAELSPKVRIEKALKVVVATTGLARGINCPARVVVLGDMQRFDIKREEMVDISVREYHQFMGRAGRFGKEDIGFGYSVIGSKEQGEERILNYICALEEPLESQLVDKVNLRKHLLATIAMDEIVTTLDLKAFIADTFLARTEVIDEVFKKDFRETIEWLDNNEFTIAREGDRHEITNLGRKTALFVLDPMTVHIFQEGATAIAADIAAGRGIDELGFLHLISYVEENGYTRSKKSQIIGTPQGGWEPPDEVIKAAKRAPDIMIDVLNRKEKEGGVSRDFYWMLSMDDLFKSRKYRFYVVPPDPEEDPIGYLYYLRSIFTAMVLRDWINEIDEEIIVLKFIQVQPGDIFRAHDRIEKMASILGRLDAQPEFGHGIGDYCDMMFWRLRKGIKAELISLAQIPDIGRVWARKLFDAGYKDRVTLAREIRKPNEYKKIEKLIGKKLTAKLFARFKKPLILKKAEDEDAKMKKGKVPEPVGAKLEDVTINEEKRSDYYNEVLEIIELLWTENNRQPVLKSEVEKLANSKYGISSEELETIYTQLSDDAQIWTPVGGRVTILPEKLEEM